MDVRIVGVLSDYLVEAEIRDEQTGRCTILGEVGKNDIIALQGWAEGAFGDFLQINSMDSAEFIPGWIFEYLEDHQPRRSQGLEHTLPLLSEVIESQLPDPIPKWLIALVNSKELVEQCYLSPIDIEIWRQLQSVGKEIGITRRSLFVLILGFTLRMAKSAGNGYHPSMWESWLFADSRMNQYTDYQPLGLIDSQKYIKNLIQVLEVMWNRARRKLSQFQRFRLMGPNILKGEGSDGAWYTVLAYCGGWRSVPVRVKCGRNPIIIGHYESCLNCHRLICPECGFCGRGCPLNDRRQKEIASVDRQFSDDTITYF